MNNDLVALAAAYGVATEYWDWQGRHVGVPATVVAVLAALGRRRHDAGGRRRGPRGRRLRALAADRCRRVVVPRQGARRDRLGARAARRRRSAVGRAGGAAAGSTVRSRWTAGSEPRARRRAAGRRGDLRAAGGPAARLPPAARPTPARPRRHVGPLVVTPAWLGLPERLGAPPGLGARDPALQRALARGRWGVGDLADLTDLARLVAAPSSAPASCWSTRCTPPSRSRRWSRRRTCPTTRRFVNPLYLRVERRRRVRRPRRRGARRPSTRWPPTVRAAPTTPSTVSTATPPGRPSARRCELRARRAAQRRPGARPRRRSARREGEGLRDFATWCALAEEHGDDWPRAGPRSCRTRTSRRGRGVPRRARRPASTSTCWLQWLLDEQLAAAQAQARGGRHGAGRRCTTSRSACTPAGPTPGRCGDVARARRRRSARRRTPFNQHGPGLEPAAVAPGPAGRAGLRAVPRHARAPCCGTPAASGSTTSSGCSGCGGSREGTAAAEGTYVRYDHEALVGILALEAHRAGARGGRRGPRHGRAVGARLPAPSAASSARRSCGSSATTPGQPLPPEQWRELCLASVTTHDLPPTAGLPRRRARPAARPARPADPAGATRSWPPTRRTARRWLDALRARGLLRDGAEHRRRPSRRCTATSPRTPARLLGVALTDAVGDRRTQNQPGTDRRVPELAGAARRRRRHARAARGPAPGRAAAAAGVGAAGLSVAAHRP